MQGKPVLEVDTGKDIYPLRFETLRPAAEVRYARCETRALEGNRLS